MLAWACTYTHKHSVHSVPPQFSFFHSHLAMSLVLLVHFLCVQNLLHFASGNHFSSRIFSILKNLVPDSRIATMERGPLLNFKGQCWEISRGLFGYEAELAAGKHGIRTYPLGWTSFLEWDFHAKIIRRIFGRQSQTQNLCFWLGVPWRCWYSDTPTFNAGRDIGPIWHLSCIFGLIEVNFDSRCHKSPNSSWMSRNECLNG